MKFVVTKIHPLPMLLSICIVVSCSYALETSTLNNFYDKASQLYLQYGNG